MLAGLDNLFGSDDTPQPGAVESTRELRRVLSLPLRDPVATAERIVEPITAMLRKPEGTMTLRPLQALALGEAHDFRGLLALLSVGEGKTLLSFLLPTILKAKRPVLIIPASLRDKTVEEFDELALHWQHTPMTLVNYELISNRPDLLEELAPDVVVCDEVHELADKSSGRTQRVFKYLRGRSRAHQRVAFCGMSGTLTKRSFKDWWHLQQFAIKRELQPLPYDYPTMQVWCEALDEKIANRRPLGELAQFAPHAPSVANVRKAFGNRLSYVPSIVVSSGADVKAKLKVQLARAHHPIIDDAVRELRKTWSTPGGEEFSEAVDMWRHARELGNGFYYKLLEPAPEHWSFARSQFHGFVRGVLKHSRKYETMSQVRDAYADHPAVTQWLAVKPQFKPQKVAVWLTDDVLEYASIWAQQQQAQGRPGLVWVEHIEVGKRLEEKFGLPYYGAKGRNAAGQSVLRERGSCAVSQKACSHGLNLQYTYADSLVLNATPLGLRYEQLIGRTHRQFQPHEVVYVQVLAMVLEQVRGFEQAQRDAQYEQDTLNQKQKLCLADVTEIGSLRAAA